MRPPFELWASQEISKLRAEANALEHALNRYLTQPSDTVNSSEGTSVIRRLERNLPESKQSGRPSKHTFILTMIDDSGPNGVTMDEIDQAAKKSGHPINRNSLRSFLWAQRNAGRLTSKEGRHVASKYIENTGRQEGETSNPPDLLAGAA